MAHFAVLKMLKKHCECHHQFLASSQLLSTNHLTALAPTSDYFQMLLKTIGKILRIKMEQQKRHVTHVQLFC